MNITKEQFGNLNKKTFQMLVNEVLDNEGGAYEFDSPEDLFSCYKGGVDRYEGNITFKDCERAFKVARMQSLKLGLRKSL